MPGKVASKGAFLDFVRNNKELIGWVIAAAIYVFGLYISSVEKISANDIRDNLQDQQIVQLKQEMGDYKQSLKEISVTIQRIDKNVVELNTKVDYKQDK